MAGLTFAPFVTFLSCSWIFVLCQETQELKVKPGEDVTLQCQSHRGAAIEVIKWSRTDLKSDDIYVFYLTPDQTNGEYQNSLFQGRVELKDPEKKNGDASVILKNVNINDTGTYECWIAVKNSGRRKKDAPEPISTIKLTVTEPDGSVGLRVGLPVVAVLLVAVAVVGMMLFKKHRRRDASHRSRDRRPKPSNIRLTDPGHTAGDKDEPPTEGTRRNTDVSVGAAKLK